MRNLFKASLVLLSVSLLSACGSPSTVTLTDTSGNPTFSSAGTEAGNVQAMKGKGGKGGHEGKGGLKGGFGQFAGVTLTEEQKTALAALRPAQEQKDSATMKTQMEAAQKALKDAFLADSINRDDLKAKLTALRPAEPNFAQQADIMIKSYNILTAEQKATLETKKQEMQAKFDQMKSQTSANVAQKPAPADRSSAMIDKLATTLGLTDAQKTSLKEALTPPVDTTDRATREAEMKANRDAVDAAVKAGDVTKLTELLSAHKKDDHLDKHIDTIVKVHDILNADQRAKIVDQLPILGLGGRGGHGGHGGPGGHEGGKMAKGGFDRGPRFGGQPPVGALNNQTSTTAQTQQI